MRRNLVFVAWLMGLCLASLCSAQIGSGKYRDNSGHFELKAAPKWSRATQQALADANGRSASANPGRTWTITMAWCKAQDSAYLLVPYVQIEVTPIDLSVMRFADIERGFSAETRPDLAGAFNTPLTQLINRLPEKTAVLDRQHARLYSKETVKDDQVSTTYIAVGFLGSRGALHLVFGCDTTLVPEYLPDFQQFVDSFAWDEGFAYTEPSQSGKNNTWSAARGKGRGGSGSGSGTSSRKRGGGGGDDEELTETEARRLGKLTGGACGIGLVIVVGVIIVMSRRNS